MKNIKRERFERVASSRVQKILDDIDILAKCSNHRNYEYSESDVKQMLTEIRKKIKYLEIAFTKETNKEFTNKFRFEK